jgi:hypothetical protein
MKTLWQSFSTIIIGLSLTALATPAKAEINLGFKQEIGPRWQNVPGCAQDISANAPFFSPYVIGCASGGEGGNQIFNLQSNWDLLPGSGVKVAVEPRWGGYWHVESSGAIRINNQLQPGCAKDIASGSAGVWITGCAPTNGGFEIYRANLAYSATELSGVQSWQAMPGGATQLAVGNKAWAINSAGNIFRFQDSVNAWEQVEGCARSIGAAGDHVWVIGCAANGAGGNEIFELRRDQWVKREGAAVKVSVDSLGNPWVVAADGAIFTWIRKQP